MFLVGPSESIVRIANNHIKNQVESIWRRQTLLRSGSGKSKMWATDNGQATLMFKQACLGFTESGRINLSYQQKLCRRSRKVAIDYVELLLATSGGTYY